MLTKAEMPVDCSDNEPGVINSSAYAGGRKVTDVAIEEAGDWSKRPGHVVWIGLFEPSDELLKRVQQQFDLHPLAPFLVSRFRAMRLPGGGSKTLFPSNLDRGEGTCLESAVDLLIPRPS